MFPYIQTYLFTVFFNKINIIFIAVIFPLKLHEIIFRYLKNINHALLIIIKYCSTETDD